MINILKEYSFDDFYYKVLNNEKITKNHYLKYLKPEYLSILSYIANEIKNRYHGNSAYFIINKHINYTNICINRCKLCSFYSRGSDSYTYDVKKILEKINLYYRRYNIREVHIVGGLNPSLEFEYYETLLREIKKRFPNLIIKAFSAVEIDFISKKFGMSYKETLLRLKDAGLDIIPGGGAEILDDNIRKKICPNKINSDTWLEIHETAHRLGIKSNATMLYGHVEEIHHRIDHLLKLKKLQEKTNGFITFLPLKFKPEGTEIKVKETTLYDDLFTIAISRIVLNNFKNITAYWITLGLETSKFSLYYGANDLGGSVYNEYIIKNKVKNYIHREEFINIIKDLGLKPIERDSYFNVIKIY